MALGRRPGRPPKSRPIDVIDLVSDDDDATVVEAVASGPKMKGKRRIIQSESEPEEEEQIEEDAQYRPEIVIMPEVRATHRGIDGVRGVRGGSSVSRTQVEKGQPLPAGSSSIASAIAAKSATAHISASARVLCQSIRDISLPRVPLQTLRRYYHFPGTSVPPQHHRRASGSGSDDGSETPVMVYNTRSRSASASTTGRPTRTSSRAKQPTRYAQESGQELDELNESSPDPIGRHYRDEIDRESGEDSETGDEEYVSGDDEVGLRRSSRHVKGSFEASRLAIKNRLRSQAALGSGLTSRSSVNPTSVSESSFYGPGRAYAQPLSRRWNTSTDVSGQSSSAYEDEGDDDEGEDELESDASESEGEQEWTESRKRGRPKTKGRGKSKRARIDSSEEEEDEEDEAEILGRHRPFCEKCKQGPADVLLEKALKKKRKGGRKRRRHEDDMSDTEMAEALEGWLECDHCVTSWHWGCLGHHQQKDALQLLRAMEGPPAPNERLRHSVRIDESVMFQCRKCQELPACMVCHEEDIRKPVEPTETETDSKAQQGSDDKAGNGDDHTANGTEGKPEIKGEAANHPMIKFRCLRCTQSAHYQHLPQAPHFAKIGQVSLAKLAEHYQQDEPGKRNAWLCHQCREWIWKVDMVIAWRPWPIDAKEEIEPGITPAWNSDLPREYLVKFADRGFRHATWVPHAWIRALAGQRLRNFLEKGPSIDLITDESLAARGDVMAKPTVANVLEEEEAAQKARPRSHLPADKEGDRWTGGGPPPDRDAKNNLPLAWSTIDRVLDVYLCPPRPRQKRMPKQQNGRIAPDSMPELSTYDGIDGLIPEDEGDLIPIDEWEHRAGRQLEEDDVDEIAGMVSWLLAKWDDLQYDQSTWDTPPPRDSELHPAYKRALKRYLEARNVRIPILTSLQCEKRDSVRMKEIKPPRTQPDCVVGGALMGFQLEGLQWLLTKYFKRDSAILADDMGLGKTVQIASMLGYLGSKDIYPCLVVVPNSTITNWVREFEKWVPHIRVVPYYGEAASRKVIREYELYHKGKQGKAEGLKAHVVLTTYDMITGKEFRVFKSIPRWEVLCIDEGQRLKSDASNIFANLKQLNSVHRLLLTGTPLNNNIRELFNLLNFLDPDHFTYVYLAEYIGLVDVHPDLLSDREALEREYDQDKLNDELVRELHTMVQPYILRRIKADVLRLPPKVEIIVPISLSNMQADVYKLILQSNAITLQRAVERREKEQKRVAARQVKIDAEAGTGTAVVPDEAKESAGQVTEGKRSNAEVAREEMAVARPTAFTTAGEEDEPKLPTLAGTGSPTAEEEVEAAI